MMSRSSISELSQINNVHDVFVVLVDASFAFELPGVSAGWVEASTSRAARPA